MKCPNCGADLAQAQRDGMSVEACPSCRGLWLTPQELDQLENQAFDLGDDKKGSLVLGSQPSNRACPECGQSMRTFQFRLYDLELEFCADGHGYWLDADEDKRVLQLMKKEEASLERANLAEDTWASHLRHIRSGAFLERLRDLFR